MTPEQRAKQNALRSHKQAGSRRGESQFSQSEEQAETILLAQLAAPLVAAYLLRPTSNEIDRGLEDAEELLRKARDIVIARRNRQVRP